MNLTLALLAVTAAIPVSLQPHSVKFYSFLVVAARPQPCRGGWRGERRKREAAELRPGGTAPARSATSTGSLVGFSRWHRPVCRTSACCGCHPVPSRMQPVPRRCRGMLWGTSPGACLGSAAQPPASQPAGCERGPVVGAGAPARLLPNERQLAICFLSAPRCSSARGDEEHRGQAVPRHRASPRSAPATRVRVPGGVRWHLPGGRTGHSDDPAGNDSILALDIIFFQPSDGRAHCLCPPQHETCPPSAPLPLVGMLPMAPRSPGKLGPNSLQITLFFFFLFPPRLC